MRNLEKFESSLKERCDKMNLLASPVEFEAATKNYTFINNDHEKIQIMENPNIEE